MPSVISCGSTSCVILTETGYVFLHDLENPADTAVGPSHHSANQEQLRVNVRKNVCVMCEMFVFRKFEG